MQKINNLHEFESGNKSNKSRKLLNVETLKLDNIQRQFTFQVPYSLAYKRMLFLMRVLRLYM